MSTLLQLVNIAREECGVSGGDLTSLSGVSGESLRFKNWVIRSWEEIQERHYDWKWLQGTYSFTTTANDGSYTSAQAGISTRFGWWDPTYCSVYLTASGVDDQRELCWMDFEDFRAIYLTGTQTDSRPLHWTIGQANELLLGPKPESTLYTVTGYYSKSPQILSANDDVPDLPEQHRVIAYLAMMRYARYEAAPEIYQDAASNYGRIMSQLRVKYLPRIQLGGPLA